MSSRFVSSRFMRAALDEAEKAGHRNEVPVGCVLVDASCAAVIAATGNRVEEFADPTAHAEMLAIRMAAASLGAPRLVDCDLYVTLEPCAMCATAISLARIRRLYFAAYDPKMGGVEHGARIFDRPTCHHRPEIVGGLEEGLAATMLKRFFTERRR